jgi:butyryl-CoA dehydrogenase
MQAFGHVVMAWIWLDVALASPSAQAADLGRRAACRYFYRYELPKINAWLQVVSAGDSTCADVPAEAF